MFVLSCSPIQHLTSPQASLEFCKADEDTAPPEGKKEDQPDLRYHSAFSLLQCSHSDDKITLVLGSF